jgi:hypothetical protein
MKSTIKVSYQPRYGNYTEREPVIKVDLAESDDPRDLLLKDLFEDGASIGLSRERVTERSIGPNGEEETILFYRKKPHELIHEISFDVIQMIGLLYPAYRFIHVYDGIQNFYFTTELEEKFRSEEMNINHLLNCNPYEIRKAFVANFREFFEKLNSKDTSISFNLAKALREFEPKQWETFSDGTEMREIKREYQPFLSSKGSYGYSNGFNSTTSEIKF